MPPLVVETFEGYDEQTQKDANELAAILSRKNKCEYKVLIDLSCVAVIHDSKELAIAYFPFLQCTKFISFLAYCEEYRILL